MFIPEPEYFGHSEVHRFQLPLESFSLWLTTLSQKSNQPQELLFQPLILGVGATTAFNRLAFSSCLFLFEVRMPHSFANYSNIAILCQTKPTVQRMTIITRIGWLGASDMLLFIILILILVLDSSNWCTYGGFRTWGGGLGSLCPQDPDPKSFHRTIWPFLWPNW